MRGLGLGLLGAIVLAGCDSGVKPADPTETKEIQAIKGRIDELSDPQRNAVFLRAIRDARQPCQGVAGSAYNGIHFNRPSWVARCSDGQDWLVMIEASGRALVAKREEAAAEK
jgi:hypothetical protein